MNRWRIAQEPRVKKQRKNSIENSNEYAEVNVTEIPFARHPRKKHSEKQESDK